MSDNPDLDALRRFMPENLKHFNLAAIHALHVYVLEQHDKGRSPQDIAQDLAFMDDPDIIRKVNQILFGVSDPDNFGKVDP